MTPAVTEDGAVTSGGMLHPPGSSIGGCSVSTWHAVTASGAGSGSGGPQVLVAIDSEGERLKPHTEALSDSCPQCCARLAPSVRQASSRAWQWWMDMLLTGTWPDNCPQVSALALVLTRVRRTVLCCVDSCQ
jgi:hypothetical protein